MKKAFGNTYSRAGGLSVPVAASICRAVLAATIALVLAAGPVLAQQEESDEQPEPKLQVFSLRHAPANEAARTLEALISNRDARIVADPRTNGLFVRAAQEAMEKIVKVLEVIDRPPQDLTMVKIFPLARIVPDEDLLQTLQRFVAGEGVVLGMDPARKAVVASGVPGSLEKIEALLMRFDEASASSEKEAPAEAGSRRYEIRIVWLASGADDKDLPLSDPPPDMEPVLEELKAIGIQDVRMVMQSVIYCEEGSNFLSRGTLSPMGLQFTIDGRAVAANGRELARFGGLLSEGNLESVPDSSQSDKKLDRPAASGPPPHPKFELMITANREYPDSKTVANLNTTIQAPPGQYIVLGVVPVEFTSIFVVKVRAL